MNAFRSAVEDNGLFYLGYREDSFTWSNRHVDDNYTKERLDRAMANLPWKNLHNHVEVECLVARSSYHKPLLVSIQHGSNMGSRYRKAFKFEACWSKDEDCGKVVEEVLKS